MEKCKHGLGPSCSACEEEGLWGTPDREVWMDNTGRIGGVDCYGEPFTQNRTPEMFAEYRDASCQQGEPCGCSDLCPDPVGCGFLSLDGWRGL